MKARILVWLVALFCCHNALFAQKEFVNASARLSGHPRILLQKGEEKALKKVIMERYPSVISGRSWRNRKAAFE